MFAFAFNEADKRRESALPKKRAFCAFAVMVERSLALQSDWRIPRALKRRWMDMLKRLKTRASSAFMACALERVPKLIKQGLSKPSLSLWQVWDNGGNYAG
jgi:hypothetical protein